MKVYNPEIIYYDIYQKDYSTILKNLFKKYDPVDKILVCNNQKETIILGGSV